MQILAVKVVAKGSFIASGVPTVRSCFKSVALLWIAAFWVRLLVASVRASSSLGGACPVPEVWI